DPIRRFGDEYSFQEVAINNIKTLQEYQFEKILTHCPHCLHTIGKEYNILLEDPSFAHAVTPCKFSVIPHTILLQEIFNVLLAPPTYQSTYHSTGHYIYHDPCYLGRHHGDFDAARTVLRGLNLSTKEMTSNREQSLCCGMGGGNMWYELPEGEHLAHNRLKEIMDTRAKKVVTACPFCQ
ncbi:MAG: (Fe-S)-binding protein, partial [Oligoflexia bacterium]|nr:(Fe-S)-binding protein [Oligoflexia bacterium]